MKIGDKNNISISHVESAQLDRNVAGFLRRLRLLLWVDDGVLKVLSKSGIFHIFIYLRYTNGP